MQLLIKKIFIDLPRKSAQLPIEYPFKVDMGKALSQMEGELPEDASLRLTLFFQKGPKSKEKHQTNSKIPKNLQELVGTKNVKELIRDGEKYVKAMGRFFRYTRGTSQYKDIQKETAQLIRAATKGQPAAQRLIFYGNRVKRSSRRKADSILLKRIR